MSGTTLETYRTSWLTAHHANSGTSVTKLRSIAPRIYTWLYRHDRIWLKEHTPVRSKKNKTGYQRVDWAERDARLAEEVISAAARLKNLPGRPSRFTLSSIGRETGQVALLQQHLDKLPYTAQALSELVETREAFAIRRIWWTATVFSQMHIYPERWLLVKKAGVARFIERPNIKIAVDAALQALELNVRTDGNI